MELKVIEGIYVEKPREWVNHKRATNYIAIVKGLDRKYGVEREFLERVKVGRESYFKKSDFDEGNIYEIRCIYYTGSGRPLPEVNSFYKCKSVTDEKILLTEIQSDDVVKAIIERYPSAREIYNEESETAKVIAETAEAERRIKEAKELRKIMTEIKTELEKEEEEVTINEDEIISLKNELERRIINISQQLLTLGEKRSDDTQYIDKTIKIKAKKKKIQYVCVDDKYVISQYDNKPSLSALFTAYKKLRDILTENAEKIDEIKLELCLNDDKETTRDTAEEKTMNKMQYS